MTLAHLAVVHTAIQHAADRNELEDVAYLQDVAAFLEKHIEPAKIPPGKYSLSEFQKRFG